MSKEFCQITAAEGEGRLLEEPDLQRGSLVSQAREEARGEFPVASSLCLPETILKMLLKWFLSVLFGVFWQGRRETIQFG